MQIVGLPFILRLTNIHVCLMNSGKQPPPSARPHPRPQDPPLPEAEDTRGSGRWGPPASDPGSPPPLPSTLPLRSRPWGRREGEAPTVAVCAKTAPLDLLTQHKPAAPEPAASEWPWQCWGWGAGLLIAVGKCRGRRPRGGPHRREEGPGVIKFRTAEK